MNDLELDQIKQLYCKYRCNLKDQEIFAVLEGGDICSECNADIETYIEDDIKIGEDNACKICQWDSIINELKEFNLIKK